MAIHVTNIPLLVDEKWLVQYLESAVGKGTVLSCSIPVHRETARSKGFGFVEFCQQEMARRAIQLSKEEKLKIYNRVLTLTMEEKQAFSRMPVPATYSIQFGKLSIGCMTSSESLHSMWAHEGPLILEVGSGSQTLAIRLKLPDNLWMMEYKMEFPFSAISRLVAAQVNARIIGFLLEVKECSPYLYCRRAVDVSTQTGDAYVDMMESFLANSLTQNPVKNAWTWVRTTDFTGKVIGQSFSYFIQGPASESESLDAFLNKTGIYNPAPVKLSIKVGKPYAAEQLVVPTVNPYTYRVPFENLYKINSLVQHGKLSGALLDADDRFFRMVRDSSTLAVSFALQAMSGLDSPCSDPIKFLREKLELYKKGPTPPVPKLKKGEVLVHRVLVTPTKIYCSGPDPEKTNRVVRQYENLSSNFLRVSFVDENLEPLSSSVLLAESHTSRSKVFTRVKDILKKGFFIGFKHYEFLAFSASQLREGQLWMYAPSSGKDSDITAEHIRSEMGNFASIRNVAKCSARMGQCFSTSTETRKVLPIQVKKLKDITVKRGPITYCFSDGIGKISETFAQTIAADCGLPSGKIPSAFQIRYGGYKGVVARDRTVSSAFKLYLRPSMHKFTSPHMGLDVLDWTRPVPCHLNRQVISLLSTLGVSDSAFLNLQSEVITKYERILDDPATAMEVLQELWFGSIAMRMLKSGFEPHVEPFLRRLLLAFKNTQLNEIKHRARIPVAKGRDLMGCLDETRTLQYGEVFVKYTVSFKSGQSRNTKVLTQKVFVAKNPCHHPGDIRILQAVDVPQLEHMVDCVVFPQCGPRPHPNECSGSDLDGDVYHVIWDESLLPPTMDPPMDYTPPPEMVLDHPVEIEEMQEFFLNYMTNDNLGVIANAHVVLADKEPDMARSPKCLELAHLASMAVDYPKTGVPAVIPTELRPQEYPDFMDKIDKATYVSQRILGMLYRIIDPTGIASPHSFPPDDDELRTCFDHRLLRPVGEVGRYLVESAWKEKQVYDKKLIELMNQFGVQEAEIVSGQFVSGRRQLDTTAKATEAFNFLERDARSRFQGNKPMDLDSRLKKASACYIATYHRDSLLRQGGTHYCNALKRKIRLLSFPWVVSDDLFNLKLATKAGSSSRGRGGMPVRPVRPVRPVSGAEPQSKRVKHSEEVARSTGLQR